MCIYDVPGIIRQALPLAGSQVNIQSGFRVSGIYPFNPHFFKPEEFMPTYGTDRPLSYPSHTTSLVAEDLSSSNVNDNTSSPNVNVEASSIRNENAASPTMKSDVCSQLLTPCPPNENNIGSNHCSTVQALSPEDVQPFPKAAARNNETQRKGKKRRSTQILTDTPVASQLREEQAKRSTKKTFMKKKVLFKGNKKQKAQKNKDDDDEEEDVEESSYCLICWENTSRPGEKWVQCIRCKNWAHELCTEYYILHL